MGGDDEYDESDDSHFYNYKKGGSKKGKNGEITVSDRKTVSSTSLTPNDLAKIREKTEK